MVISRVEILQQGQTGISHIDDMWLDRLGTRSEQ